MPLIRYEVTLPVEAQRHPSAFAPVPVSTIAKYAATMAQGWTVCGEPGTQRIPAPYAMVAAGGVRYGAGAPLPGGSGGAGNTGSAYMPPAWYPSLYYAHQDLWGGIGGVAAGYLLSGAGGPTPATHPTHQAVATTQVPGFRPQRTGRRWLKQRQVAAHPNAPRWKKWGHHAHPGK